MFDKRLMAMCPESKKYIAGNIIFQWLELCMNAVMIGLIALSAEKLYRRELTLSGALPSLLLIALTILGNLGILLDHIRAVAPNAPIIGGNPVERADFVYLLDPENNAQGSYAPEQSGEWLRDVSAAIRKAYAEEGVVPVDLWGRSGFTQDRLIRFKHVRTDAGYADLPYPEYVGIPFDPLHDEHPYPPECAALTYDGLHPSDEGADILAGLFAEAFRSVLANN